MRLKSFVIFLLFIVPCCLLTASCSDSDSKRDELADDASALVASVGNETGIPGVTVYVKSEKYGDFSFAWGMTDLENQTPASKRQPFRIGSLSKSFTAAAVLKLTEAGLIDLDAPISDYLGLVNDYAPLAQISTRQVMNMSSGLAPYASESFILDSVLVEPLRAYAPEELLAGAFTAQPELLFTPGSEYLYTNTNYVLLGMLIEAVSGQSYQDYLQTTFLTPLGLTATSVVTDATLPDGLARGYLDYDEDGSYEDWTQMDMSYVWSAGCLVSNARDIAVWMDALARGELVDAAHYPDLFEGQQMAEGVVYGAGIVVADGYGIGHNGTVIGYHADAWHDPATGTTVAVLCNTNAPLLSDEIDPTKTIADGILALFK